jgi:hypothetical protein
MSPAVLPLVLVILVFLPLAGCQKHADSGFRQGLALSEIHPGHGDAAYEETLQRIRDVGAGWVLLPVYGYMDSAASAVVDTTWEPPVTMAEYVSFVGGIVRDAHAKGLQVAIVPYLNLRSGPVSDWRGNIRPGDWDRWFASYEQFLDRWVELARSETVEMLAVGAELVSSEDSTAAWRRIVSGVRSRYAGTVIYSFNWDHYSEAHFHRDLDLVGISGYFSLPAHVPITEESIEANWRDVREKLLVFSRDVDRPLLFTEIGYASVVGSAREPWNYLLEGPVDLTGQAQAISAFIRAWEGTPELDGVFFWNLSPVRGGAGDTSYSIRDKPAEAVIRKWFSRNRIAPSSGVG